MAEDVVSIIKIETGQAVKSVNDLKENVKFLKERLGELNIGSTEYQETLEQLKINQAAVKDAMYATHSTIEEVAANAKGLNVVFDEQNKLINQENQSYNALVNTMAELKTRWRATSDEAKRAELGEQIKQVNDRLKDMDASVGNFQRNVGNYPGLMKTFSGSLDALDKGLKVAKGGVGDLKNGFDGLAANPSFAILGIVFNLFTKLTEDLKENESAMAGVKNVMNSLKPIMDFFRNVLDKVVNVIADLVVRLGEFMGNSGLFKKIVDGVVGIGNAIVQYVIAPFKAVIAAIKVFKEEGIKGFRDAGKAFLEEMKNGIAFKSNFQAGQEVANAMRQGIKDKEEEIQETASEVGKSAGEKMGDGIMEGFKKALAEANRKFDEELRERLALQKELDQMTEDEFAKTNAEIDAYFAEQDRIAEESKKKQEDIAKAKVEAMWMVVDASSSIMSSLADIMEADEKGSEKNAKKVKALRIASTTIDTLSGAVAAFNSVWKSELPLTAKAITAPLTTASVLAAGMAQIAKMKSVSETGSASAASVSAVPAAPSTSMSLPQVRSVTSASEEDRLNQMASDQRVVLVMSDLEVKQNQSKIQVAEASF